MTIQEALNRAIYVKDLMDGTVIIRIKSIKPNAQNPYKQQRFCFTSCSICNNTYLRGWYEDRKRYEDNTKGWCSPKCRRKANIGKNNPKFKPYKVSKEGYEYVNYWEDGKRKHMDRQRFVMQKYMGRKLCPKTERIHHIDMDKLNNNLDNLWICNNSKHMIAHHSMNTLVAQFMKMDLVGFHKEAGKYYLK